MKTKENNTTDSLYKDHQLHIDFINSLKDLPDEIKYYCMMEILDLVDKNNKEIAIDVLTNYLETMNMLGELDEEKVINTKK